MKKNYLTPKLLYFDTQTCVLSASNDPIEPKVYATNLGNGDWGVPDAFTN